MKRKFFQTWQLLFTMVLLMFIFSCSPSDNDSNKENKLETTVDQAQKKSKGAESRKDNIFKSTLGQLKLNKETRKLNRTIFRIDKIDNKKWNGKDFKVKATNNIEFTGWAVDIDDKKAAGGVFIKIEDKLFPADYGFERVNVKNSLKIGSVNVGFKATIPVKEVRFDPNGQANVKLIILNSKKDKYYSTGKILSLVK